MAYIDGKLVVDEIIIDPALPLHMVIRIGTAFYTLSNASFKSSAVESDLRPYKKPIDKSWYRPSQGFEYSLRGLVPRGGYDVSAGRAATDSEFAEIVSKYGLTDDDITGVFTDSVGGMFGERYQIAFPARQIRVPDGGAIGLERELRDKGIEASNGSPGRVNIRVEG